MNLFKYDDIVEDGNGLTDGQIKKKKMRKKSQRLENEPIFKGKVNLSMEELNGADEVWLIKVPKMIRADRLEGQDLVIDENKQNVLELNNGVELEAKVQKCKFKLPYVFPKSDRELIAQRVEDGLQAEKAYKNSEKFEGTEEQGTTCAVSFKGTITLSRKISVGVLPKPEPEVIEKVPQPELKRRHPFFGMEDPPTPIEPSSPSKNTRKRKKRKD